MSAWRGALADPVLMAMVLVTALAGAGQFALFSYLRRTSRTSSARAPAKRPCCSSASAPSA